MSSTFTSRPWKEITIRRGGEEVATYGELFNRAGRASSALGVGSEQRALLVFDDTPAWPTSLNA